MKYGMFHNINMKQLNNEKITDTLIYNYNNNNATLGKTTSADLILNHIFMLPLVFFVLFFCSIWG